MRTATLARLIQNAIDDCWTYGSGSWESEDFEEPKLGFRVTAEWVLCDDPDQKNIIAVCIYQNDVLILSYQDPATKC